MSLDYATLELLKQNHPAWRLLNSPHAPLIASFLHRAFVAPNQRLIVQADLVEALEDELFGLRERLGGLYVRRGEWDQALAQYRAAQTQAPTSLALSNNVAFVLAESGRDPQGALTMARQVAEAAPRNTQYAHTLAVASLRAGQPRLRSLAFLVAALAAVAAVVAVALHHSARAGW